MGSKKAPLPPPIDISSAESFRRKLENLYARRSALTTLIASLEEYDRVRARRFEDRKRQPA